MKNDTAPLEEIIARHEDLIISLGKALNEITNAVRGQPPKGSSWGTHDVENRVKSRLVQDEALIRQALDALDALNPYPASAEQKRDAAIEALRNRLHLCPDCGSDTRLSRGWVSNIETFWLSCEDCDWRGDPE